MSPERSHADLQEGARLWIVDLDRAPARHAVLDARERARLARLPSARAARRYTARRSALRSVLGAALAQAPEQVALTPGPHGKPSVAGETGLAFNLSHRGPLAVIALARAPSVGVDVEAMRPTTPPQRLARRFFDAQEAETIAGLPAELAQDAFLRCWTAKEAVLKAIGTGLETPMREVRVSADPREPLRLLALPHAHEPARWTLHELRIARGRLALSLAIGAPEHPIAGVEAMPSREAPPRSAQARAVAPRRIASAALP